MREPSVVVIPMTFMPRMPAPLAVIPAPTASLVIHCLRRRVGLYDYWGRCIALDNDRRWRRVDRVRRDGRANEAADDTADDPAENCRASIVPMGEGMQGQR